MTEFENANFFTDESIQHDPYPYFDWVRGQGRVWEEPNYGVFMITGYQEAMSVYGDPATSPANGQETGPCASCNAVSGPFVKFSVPVEGDDISEIIVSTGTNSPSATNCLRSTRRTTLPIATC